MGPRTVLPAGARFADDLDASIVAQQCLDWLPAAELRGGGSGRQAGRKNATPERGRGPLMRGIEARGRGRARCSSADLGTLDANERQAIVMAFSKACPHAELAATLGRALCTVKTWVRRRPAAPEDPAGAR